MDIQPIKNALSHATALAEIEALMRAKRDTPDGDRLDVLVTLVQAYEAKHHPIDPPDPIEAIRFRMDQSGLSVKDLVPYIGPINRVYEVLARKRPLTLNMIRRLTQIVIPRQRTRIAYLQPTCSLWRERQCSNMQTLQVRVLWRSP